MKDPSTATALEVAAGGKMYQVVVDSDKTAKALLDKGSLTKRVTIIPLNQVGFECHQVSHQCGAAVNVVVCCT